MAGAAGNPLGSTGNKGPSARSALRGPDPSFCHVAERHLHLSQRPDPLAATTELRSLLRFTAPSLPSELDEAGTSKLLAELHRRGEATVRELLEVLEPARRGAGQRAVLWLLRVGLAVRCER